MKTKRKLYVAYGSNLNLEQMSYRCPNSKVVGAGMLKGWRLLFNNYATILPDAAAETPVAVWSIDERDERALDFYEGYPRLYRKESVLVAMQDGSECDGMVYIMNRDDPRPPMQGYLQIVKQGYHDVGLDTKYLDEALRETISRQKKH